MTESTTPTSNYSAVLIEKFGEKNYSYAFGNHVVWATTENLVSVMTKFRDELGFNMILDVCGVDNTGRPKSEWTHGKRFESVYHLLNMENHERVRVRVPVDADGGEMVPSVMSVWKGADWFEREAWDMFGINYEGRKKERLLTHHEFVGHPLRKDYRADHNQPLSESIDIHFDPDPTITHEESLKREWINIGPSHPATHGTLRIMAEIEGEVIKRSKLEIGYLHRCFEKMTENHLYNQVVPYTDRLNYCSSPMNNIGWCKAIEDMMGIEIPDRAKAIRMVLAELSRIIDHMVCIGAAGVDLGALTSFWYCFEMREKVYELFEKLCGARLTVSLTRIGGQAQELPVGWVTDCLDVVKQIEKRVDEVDALLTKNKIYVDRTKVTPITAKNAIDWGYTGPCLRAAGVNYDIRKTNPYYFYKDVEFEIPVGYDGTPFDRYVVRMEEMRQSCRIINQVLANLPAGGVQSLDKRVCIPPKKEVYTNIEGLMNHFMLIMKGVRPPVGEIYSATEAANGELGFYVISDGGPNPFRVKVRPPCFAIYQSYGEVVNNHMLADAVAQLSSMNIIAGELDR
ncbi:NADH-quinone oxidoreductase subunit C [Bacteriovorax stolpii]|uniref:NADH dehydrogenase (quinone) subunit D n=1 Tax=Bacteriovorax stolpii TaxID=960 RepID=UPI001159D8FC|nr:NADH dehydrogenase (quinone) subunit D [Bacteriovorax stolpii]QDK41249.1 NADH-quinone oxidoreductase subunit C [Bacteriovorax stolpii]